ncbi:MAG TPA: CHAD domain-containing protein, partial [Solirubrobacterales bacterium]
MARAREVPGFDCCEPFARAAARVVEVRAAEVFEQVPGVLNLGDVERVHDMRVATRRLRAALEVFEPCFPRERRRKALKKVKAL